MITYLLVVLGVLSTEINLLIIDQCPICFENFNRSSRKSIILHRMNNVEHTFCKSCLVVIMNEIITRCPICRYELNLQEKNQLQNILNPNTAIRRFCNTCQTHIQRCRQCICNFFQSCLQCIRKFLAIMCCVVVIVCGVGGCMLNAKLIKIVIK